MPIDLVTLTRMDAKGYTELVALNDDGRQAATQSRAHTFVCDDGKVYWLKGRAQRGLVADLIGGRLAARVKAGPVSRIVRVPSEAVPPDGSQDHLLGLVVGSEDEKAAVNSRELDRVAPATFDPRLIDPASRALVVAFQTWIGVGDTQVLVNLKTGYIRSIDHGECFMNPARTANLMLNRLSIKGVPDGLGSDPASRDAAAGTIEAVSDQDILEAVSGVPDGASWDSACDRRLAIATWLVGRRGKIREVLETWA